MDTKTPLTRFLQHLGGGDKNSEEIMISDHGSIVRVFQQWFDWWWWWWWLTVCHDVTHDVISTTTTRPLLKTPYYTTDH